MKLKPLCVFLVGCLLCFSVAVAVELDIWRLPAGVYAVQNGQIIKVNERTIDDVPTPPTPDPIVPSPTTLTQAIVAAVNKVPSSDKRHEVAMKLGKTYEMLGGQTIPPAKAVEVASKFVPLALGQDAAVLSGACSAVDAALAKCTTNAAVSAVFKEAGAALASTVPVTGDDDSPKAAAKRYGFDWDKFMAFLMQLLQVLLPIILKI